MVNTAAREVSGLPRITRIEALHMITGAHSIRNLYVLQCGLSMHSILQCGDSGVRERLLREVCLALRRSTLDKVVVPIPLEIAANLTRDVSEVPTEVLHTSRWMRSAYPEPWVETRIAEIRSMYYTHAP